MDATILNKFLLALSKTRDAILQDLDNEFVSIRITAEEPFDECDSASGGLVAVETVINSVFDRIGIDISNYDQTKGLVDAVGAVFKLTDSLAEDVRKIADNPSDAAQLAANVADKVKDVISIIAAFKDVEYGKIKEEFENTPYEDVSKTIGRRLLDHVIITLLRNMRGAFDDEIEYCRILARDIKADIASFTSGMKGTAGVLLKDAEERACELASRLGDELAEIKKNVEDLGDDIATDNIYIKTSRTLSCIYAVLDFLGLIGTATIEIKIPGKVTGAIAKATSFADESISGLGPILDIISLSPTTFDNIKSRIGSAGEAASSLSYPYTIDVINWSSLKTIFTDPLAYLKGMYHVDGYDEAAELLTKIMALVRVFNPDVPDFASIKNMLITLVRQIEDRILTAAKETADELWKRVEPFVVFIRMMIELLEQVADKLKEGIRELLDEFRTMIAMLGKDLDCAFNHIEQSSAELARFATGKVEKAGDIADEAWDKINESACEAYSEFRKEFGKIGIDRYLSFDEDAVKDIVRSFADGLAAEAGKQLSDADIAKCVTAIKAWFEYAKKELYRSVSPEGWYKRFDKLAADLEKAFKEDASAVTSIVSASGIRKLAGNFKGTLKDTFSRLDISDYIKIITTAVDEVAIPDPQSYYNSFSSTVKDCFKGFGNVDAAVLWDAVKRKLLTPLLDYLKDLVIDSLCVLMDKFLTEMVAEHGNEIKALVNFKNLVSDLKGIAGEVKAGRIPDKAITLVSDCATEAGKTISVGIDSDLEDYGEYLSWISWTVTDIIKLSTKSPSAGEVFTFLNNFYSKVPKVIRDGFYDLFPSMPSNGFTDYIGSVNYTLDVDSRFFCATLLNLKGGEKGDVSKGSLSAILQICIFVGDYKTGEKGKDGKDRTVPAVFFIPVISTKGELVFELGNNLLTLELSADINKVVQDAVGEPNLEFNLDFTDGALPQMGGTGVTVGPDDQDAGENDVENEGEGYPAIDEEDLEYEESGGGYEVEEYDPVNADDVAAFGDVFDNLVGSLSDGQSILDFYRDRSGNPFASREDMKSAMKKWEDIRNGK